MRADGRDVRQIAAQALAQDLVLVTDNVVKFQRVDGLVVESWRA